MTAEDTGLTRRGFLTLGGGVAIAGVAAGVGGRLAWSSLIDQHVGQAVGPGSPAPGSTAGSTPSGTGGRVLVIVQMSGGNDGLNTLVPVGDGRYFDARPTLRVQEHDVLRLRGTDHYGFNPALQPLVPVWERSQLAAVDAVGLPGQTRSHFAAMDAWWSASADHAQRTGWVGRWLDRTGDPTNPLRAIALGGGSPALMGERAIATVVRDPRAFSLRTPKGADATTVRNAFLATAAPLAADAALAAAQAAVPAAVHAVDLLAQAASAGTGTGTATGTDQGLVPANPKGPGATTVEALLQTAAGIIDLRLGTQVILVAADGFDTHADQTRRHTELLTDLATGISSFLSTLEQRGHANDVLVMTTSEFGRRVTENGSGTDHGNGGVQFLAGPMVAGAQIVGEADLVHLDQGDLAAGVDTRSLYANALDWLGGDGSTDEVLGARYDRYGLVRV